MKAVLISIQPKWCELIASGRKTIEIRKTRPKIEMPFKCYIYMTATKERCILWEYITAYQNSNGDILNGSQKVIGSFVCDSIDTYHWEALEFSYWIRKVQGIDVHEEFTKGTCVSYEEAYSYLDNKNGFGWHISDLKIYDKPKEIYNFHRICNKKCSPRCDWYIAHDYTDCGCGGKPNITRPPQSWMFVEE